MESRPIGRSGLETSGIVLGTWAIGGWLWGGTGGNDAQGAVEASLDAGVTCVDTAPVYGFGLSEELVGKALARRRDSVLVATKCGLVWDDRPGKTHFFDTQDNRGRPLSVYRCLRKKSILSECDESLRRLGVDEIDLYQCHWPDPGTPIDETMDALVTLKDHGKIRAFGVSNFSAEQVADSLEHAEIASNQVKYSLLTRDIEDDALPFCADKSVGILCYSPMERGILTGKITMDTTFPENDARLNQPWYQPEKRRQALDALEKIRPVAQKHDATLAQVAVAWILAQPGVTAAIVGARNREQAESNVRAGALKLDSDDVREIRSVFEGLVLDEPYDPAKAKR